ncbi:MAG: molybdopterin-dependent oxidoreductase [bacterium]
MPTFLLDDEPVDFKPGENVLAAALRHGREIPHYCYHPGLKVTAQCRMCLVDIVDMGNGRGMPKLQAACSTPLAEGMKVESRSDKVKHGQNLVSEFLLVNHPLDCPICDQAGECELQNFSFDYGTGQSEMEYEKRVYGLREVGTFIVLERNRCIHCSRCERFTRDVTGTHDFGTFLRSHELTFDTFEDYQITDRFQGNLADICPVGAITNRDWRFRKRAWKLVKTPSVCPSCSTGCNITVEHQQNRIFRLKPRENQQVNRWWMCDEGRVGFKPLNDRRTRLGEPQVRVKGRFQTAQWGAVMEAIAMRLKEIGAREKQVIALCDTQATNEEMFLLRKLLADGFGSQGVFFPLMTGKQQEKPAHPLEDDFIFTLITTDKSPNTEGAKRGELIGDRDDKRLKAALKASPKVVFVLGAPFQQNAEIRAAVAKAELIVYIHAFANAWSEAADVVLPGYTYAEKYGTWINKAGRLQRIQPALIPPEQARDQVWILSALLGAPESGESFADGRAVLEAMAAQGGDFAGIGGEQIGHMGLQLKKAAKERKK